MSNGKIPSVQRDSITGGLTGESAYHWACFLYEEADMINDSIGYGVFKDIADKLKPEPGKPIAMGFYSKNLEEAIQAWTSPL